MAKQVDTAFLLLARLIGTKLPKKKGRRKSSRSRRDAALRLDGQTGVAVFQHTKKVPQHATRNTPYTQPHTTTHAHFISKTHRSFQSEERSARCVSKVIPGLLAWSGAFVATLLLDLRRKSQSA